MSAPDPADAPSTWSDSQTRADAWRMAEHWPELVVALTDQSVQSVSQLQRGLDLLLNKGRITPDEYKVLAQPAEKLKHCSVSAQQIVRFQSGRVRQSHEKIDLAYLLECVLQERKNELTLLGITLRRRLKAVDVLLDPTLGFSLTNAMLDWGMRYGHRIDWRLETGGEPAQARLWMKVHPGDTPTPASGVFEDNIHWLLLRQIAATDGAVTLDRQAPADGVELTVVFRRTVQVAQSTAEVTQAPTEGVESAFRSVSGAYVMVLSADAWLRNEAVSALKRLGVAVDGVQDTYQAQTALRDRAAPHLVVLDMAMHPENVRPWVEELKRSQPHLLIVEIAAEGQDVPPPGAQPGPATRLARESVHASLGSTVMFALSKVM